jgi:YihY family inner membrane protein
LRPQVNLSVETLNTAAAAAPARTAATGWSAFGHRLGPTLRYLASTDVHTFAFSVAANAILSFFPFLMLMLTATRRVFHSPAMTAIILDLLRDYLPVGQEFIIGNLRRLVGAHGGIQVFSLFMLLVTSTGVFLPLEVALNGVWGFPKNRSYLRNQIVSLGLAFAAGALAMLSVALTAGNQRLLQVLLFGSRGFVFEIVGWLVMKIFAVLASITIFFLIYWLLPNGKVPARVVAPAAVLTGLLWELAKYGYILALPWLDFQAVYGPFAISVTLMFWAFLSGLLLLGGAHLSAQPHHHEDTKARS